MKRFWNLKNSCRLLSLFLWLVLLCVTIFYMNSSLYAGTHLVCDNCTPTYPLLDLLKSDFSRGQYFDLVTAISFFVLAPYLVAWILSVIVYFAISFFQKKKHETHYQ